MPWIHWPRPSLQSGVHEYWNPEELLRYYGTPLWDQATQAQRVLLNQLYWIGCLPKSSRLKLPRSFESDGCGRALWHGKLRRCLRLTRL